MLRFLTAGESHGKCLTTIIEGLPAGLTLEAGYINEMLARRQGGYGRGGRMKIETDQVEITAGVRRGVTLGSPVSLTIRNRDWDNWVDIMSPEINDAPDKKVVSCPRPGHADLPGGIKYGHRDLRNVLERSSARETAARVAAGAAAKALLCQLGVEMRAHVVRIGAEQVEEDLSWKALAAAAGSPVYCAGTAAAERMIGAIEQARQQGDTLGGVFEVRVKGLPVGLGSHVHWERRLDGQLAQALMSIQAIKGVEIGRGFAAAALPGSQVHDQIYHSPQEGFYRVTNFAGGLEGGITNGEELVVRAAMKPIPTLMRPLDSVNIETKEPEPAVTERSDVCAVPAASVVGEAAVAFTLAAAVLEVMGGDTMKSLRQRWEAWCNYTINY